MTNGTRLTGFALVSTLVVALAVPMAAHAGTLTIYNDDCRFKSKEVVYVNVWDKDDERKQCTRTRVTVKQGHPENIELVESYEAGGRTHTCKYTHVARGVRSGKDDVRGNEDAHVTCKADYLGFCHCTKDGARTGTRSSP